MKFQLKGKKAVKSRSGKNVYCRLEINGKVERVVFPNDMGVKDGDLLLGEIDVAEKDYEDENKVAFKRWDVMDYSSRKDQLEVLKIESAFKSEVATLAKVHSVKAEDILSLIS